MEIQIKGYSVIIDDEDYDKIANGNMWQVHICESNPYLIYFYRFLPRVGKNKRPREYLHRILCPGIGDIVDHANGNTMDNRKSNLRRCSYAQNVQNRRITKGCRSGYKGVSYFKRDNLYRARIRYNKKEIILGYRKTPEEAHELYKAKALELFGEYANFDSVSPS